MHNDTITLFNRKKGSAAAGDTWYPTVIRNVNLNIDRTAILAKDGPEAKDSAMLSIRYARDCEHILIAEKKWVPPKKWDGAEDALTFNPDGDFFWQGEWTGGIVSDAEYSTEGFYGYMNRKHDYVFAVSSVEMFSVIPHFEIIGK